MARPTDEVKNHIVKCRIGDELYGKLKGDNISDILRNALESYVAHNNNFVPQEKNNVTQNKVVSANVGLLSDLPFDVEIELKDTLRMVELSSSKEEVPLFLKDLHDRLESGELQIENGKLKLGYSEVFEVLNRAETKKWLKGVWNMCEEKGLDYKTGLRSVFEMGSKAVISGMGSQQEVNYIP